MGEDADIFWDIVPKIKRANNIKNPMILQKQKKGLHCMFYTTIDLSHSVFDDFEPVATQISVSAPNVNPTCVVPVARNTTPQQWQ